MFSAFMFTLMVQAAPLGPPVQIGAPLIVEAQNRMGAVCMSATEARSLIVRNRLANPLSSLRILSRRTKAEPLRSRLCRLDGRLVYEMTMLRRDGRVLRVYVDARDGRSPVARPR